MKNKESRRKCPKCKIEMEKITRRGQGYNIDVYDKCYKCGRQMDRNDEY